MPSLAADSSRTDARRASCEVARFQRWLLEKPCRRGARRGRWSCFRLLERSACARPVVANHGRGDEESACGCANEDGAQAHQLRVTRVVFAGDGGNRPGDKQTHRRGGEDSVRHRGRQAGGARRYWLHLGARRLGENERAPEVCDEQQRHQREAKAWARRPALSNASKHLPHSALAGHMRGASPETGHAAEDGAGSSRREDAVTGPGGTSDAFKARQPLVLSYPTTAEVVKSAPVNVPARTAPKP